MKKRGFSALKTCILIFVVFIVLSSASLLASYIFTGALKEERPAQENIETTVQDKPVVLELTTELAEPQETVEKSELSLAGYPSLLLSDKKFYGYIVTGSNVSAAIQKAADDLKESIGVKFEKSRSEELEIGNDLLGSVIGEDPAMNERDLPTLLATGTIENSLGVSTYTQTLFMPEGSTELAIDNYDADQNPKPALVIRHGKQGYGYKVTFLPAIEGKHLAGNIDKLQNLIFKFLGEDYALLKAEHRAQNDVEFTFIRKDIEDLLEEGEVKTYTIDGNDYEIELLSVSANPRAATFKINGVVVNNIEENSAKVINSDFSIGAVNIYENEAGEPGTGDMVRFFVGDYIIFRDQDTTKDDFVSKVSTNNETLSSLHVNIGTALDDGVRDGNKVKLAYIEIRYTPTKTLYIDNLMSNEVVEKESENDMLLGSFDVKFDGVLTKEGEQPSIEEYSFYPSNNYNYNLKFANKFGQVYDREVLACTTVTCNNIAYGKFSGNSFTDLVVNESEQIDMNDWFFLHLNSRSHIMQLDDINAAEREITITDLAEAKKVEEAKSYKISYNSTGVGKFELDDGTFMFNASGDTAQVLFDMNGDGDFSDSSITLTTKNLGYLVFSASNENLSRIEFRTSELYKNTKKDSVYIPVFFNSNNELDINGSAVTGAWKSGFNVTDSNISVNGPLEVESNDSEVGWTEFGLRGELTNNELDHRSTFNLYYPKTQLSGYVDVYGTYQEEVVKKDNEVQNKNRPMILIGNACTNKLIYDIMDKPEPCDKGLRNGEGIIKIYEHAFGMDNLAITITGKNDDDILNAAKVMTNYKNYNLTSSITIVKKQMEFVVEDKQ